MLTVLQEAELSAVLYQIRFQSQMTYQLKRLKTTLALILSRIM